MKDAAHRTGSARSPAAIAMPLWRHPLILIPMLAVALLWVALLRVSWLEIEGEFAAQGELIVYWNTEDRPGFSADRVR